MPQMTGGFQRLRPGLNSSVLRHTPRLGANFSASNDTQQNWNVSVHLTLSPLATDGSAAANHKDVPRPLHRKASSPAPFYLVSPNS